jgi:hypothetical protein
VLRIEGPIKAKETGDEDRLGYWIVWPLAAPLAARHGSAMAPSARRTVDHWMRSFRELSHPGRPSLSGQQLLIRRDVSRRRRGAIERFGCVALPMALFIAKRTIRTTLIKEDSGVVAFGTTVVVRQRRGVELRLT